MMQESDNAVKLIKESEGCRLKIYYDNAGNGTIGWGHKIIPGDEYAIIEQGLADIILEDDIEIAVHCINGLVKVVLTQCQFDALIDFVYNLGCTSFRNSTLLKKLNMSDFEGAANEFGEWIYCDGKVLPGLVTRRAKEKELFLTPC